MVYIIAFIGLAVIAGRVYRKVHGHVPEWKYFKPYSMTWWVAVAPGIIGILISGEPLTGWIDLATTLAQVTGNVDPSILIYGSLGGIGLAGRADK